MTRFDLLLMGAELAASPATEKSFRNVCPGVPVIELGSEFSTLEASQATAELMEKIAARLQSASGS